MGLLKYNNVLFKNLNHASDKYNSIRYKSNFITLSNMNQNVKKLEYAVRGPLVIRASEIEKELLSGVKKPFDEVIRANIGDCHAMGQKPLTYLRQVLACVSDTELMRDSRYPSDVRERARELLDSCAGMSVGSYSDSGGIERIRRDCAEYITKRDNVRSDWQNIVLTTGASEGVRGVLALINSTMHDDMPSGVMIPIPQYPLYSATLSEYGMYQINYYLDESNQWSLDINELKRAIKHSRDLCRPKAIVVINPGNPTGSVLTKQNIVDIIKFAKDEGLMIIADEVYQHNIYEDGAEFHSFKQVMSECAEHVELVSLMSASKGFMGECGLRGGYCELVNFDSDVQAMFYKMLSARLCSSVLGQIALDCVVKPPESDQPSYHRYLTEKSLVLDSLKSRAQLVANTFNSIPHVKSNKVAGAMYAFPQIILPDNAIKSAKLKNQPPDFFYAMTLLETTGICVVPGSGFGQLPGTYHFRTTILPQPDNLKPMLTRFADFHVKFIDQFK